MWVNFQEIYTFIVCVTSTLIFKGTLDFPLIYENILISVQVKIIEFVWKLVYLFDLYFIDDT